VTGQPRILRTAQRACGLSLFEPVCIPFSVQEVSRYGMIGKARNGGVVEISCLDVIRELSSYIDNDVPADLRGQIEAHLPNCAHCTAIFDGLRNTITLVGDDRSFELPAGFSQRLRAKLAQEP